MYQNERLNRLLFHSLFLRFLLMKSTRQLKVAIQPPHVNIEYIFSPKSSKTRFLVKNQRPNRLWAAARCP